MAIEDEIINISDIDVGTEILNTDQLIIETNNGTKLLKFKDFVIGEENITFKNKLVQGASTGASNTTFDTVTGYNILTSDTTAGHVTKYNDVSGSIELSRFNYSAVTELARLSATIVVNEAEISNLKSSVAELLAILKDTDSAALNSVALTTKAVNFRVNNNSSKFTGKQIGFDNTELDPTGTNSSVGFTLDPFKITFPSDATFANSWVIFIFNGGIGGQSGSDREPLFLMQNGTKAFETQFAPKSSSNKTQHICNFAELLYVTQGDVIQLRSGSEIGLDAASSFSGVKLS